MNDLVSIAARAVKTRLFQLYETSEVAEREVFLSSNDPMEVLTGIRNLYLGACKELADFCIEQYRWINRFSTSTKTQDIDSWLEHCAPHLEKMRAYGEYHLDVKDALPLSELSLSVSITLFNTSFKEILVDLDTDLEKTRAELASAEKRKWLGRREKFLWLLLGSFLGAALTMFGEHLAK